MLWALGGEEEFSSIFKELKLEHLTLDYEEEDNDNTLQRMARASGNAGPQSCKRHKKKQKADEHHANANVPGDTRHVLLWIWFAWNDLVGGSDGLYGCEYLTSFCIVIEFNCLLSHPLQIPQSLCMKATMGEGG